MRKTLSILSISACLLSCGDGQAAEQTTAAENLTVDQICRLAWEQNQDQLGNPFPMLTTPGQPWTFTVDYAGRKLYVRPARMLDYQVETDSGIVDCSVPLSWTVLDSGLEVKFDPQFKNKRQITMINGKPFGSETRGGLYIRHLLIPSDPVDVNLAWFLKSPTIQASELIQTVREQLHLPAEQAVELKQMKDLLSAQGPMAIRAIGMSVGQEPLKHWAHLPTGAAQLWPQLAFLPVGDVPAASSVEQAWTQARILDLASFKLWDIAQKRPADCATVGSASRIACRQIVDDSFHKVIREAQDKNSEVCVHLAIPGAEFSPYFVASFCINAEGQVRSLGSQPTANPGFLLSPMQGR